MAVNAPALTPEYLELQRRLYLETMIKRRLRRRPDNARRTQRGRKRKVRR